MNEKEITRKTPPGAIDDLTMQNMIRKRYCKNWPDTILQLTKRVQAVNQTWMKVMHQIMTIPGLRISYRREGDMLVIQVTIGADHERHEIGLEELQAAHQYIEVLIMDKLDHSELLARHS